MDSLNLATYGITSPGFGSGKIVILTVEVGKEEDKVVGGGSCEKIVVVVVSIIDTNSLVMIG